MAYICIMIGQIACADDVVRLSAIKGGSVTLHINPDEIQKAADLLWTFNDEDTFIAKIDRETHETSIPRNTDERFRNRLQVDQTGSLNITDVRTTDSGLYKLQISRSSGISYKRFDVTVTAAVCAHDLTSSVYLYLPVSRSQSGVTLDYSCNIVNAVPEFAAVCIYTYCKKRCYNAYAAILIYE
ncbi:putative SLAM family member 6, partial [Triplophysa rosa]